MEVGLGPFEGLGGLGLLAMEDIARGRSWWRDGEGTSVDCS